MTDTFFQTDPKITAADAAALELCRPRFDEVDKITYYNQQKVLHAFIEHRVSEACFAGSTGYGYGDLGRDKLEQVFATAVGAEDALFRHSFASGTHTLTVALFGVLRPGDKMLCLTGRPYDTLLGVLGHEKPVCGSLCEFGVQYNEVALDQNGAPDKAAIAAELQKHHYKMAYIQRSRGYSLRPSLSVAEIGELCKLVKEISPETVVMVDNCYGEFVECQEPTQVGADLMAGSLIKNPGGGIAPCGGYIAGRADLVEACAARMTAPGVGREVGASLGANRELYMGLFSAPHVVGEAIKTVVWAAALFEKLGYKATPAYDAPRVDIIESIELGSEAALVAFCQGLQSGAPVDSFVTPEPWDMPGYDNQVIMSAGTFTGGASIELSADAPMREPYAVWLQGGLNFHSAKTGVLLAAQEMLKRGLL